MSKANYSIPAVQPTGENALDCLDNILPSLNFSSVRFVSTNHATKELRGTLGDTSIFIGAAVIYSAGQLHFLLIWAAYIRFAAFSFSEVLGGLNSLLPM